MSAIRIVSNQSMHTVARIAKGVDVLCTKEVDRHVKIRLCHYNKQ